jgi:hypothetical protein
VLPVIHFSLKSVAGTKQSGSVSAHMTWYNDRKILLLHNLAYYFFYLCQTRSKRFLEVQKLRDWKKEYDVASAVMLMKEMAGTKFVESTEAHFRLNLDPKYSDQQLRASVCSLIFLYFN